MGQDKCNFTDQSVLRQHAYPAYSIRSGETEWSCTVSYFGHIWMHLYDVFSVPTVESILAVKAIVVI